MAITNLNFADRELLIFLGAFALMWLAIIYERKRVKIEVNKALEKLKKSQGNLQNLVIDIDGLSSRLTEIHEFTMSAIEIGTKEVLGKAIVDLGCKITHAAAGSVMLIDPSKSELNIIASRGINDQIVNAIKVKLGESISGRAAQTGKAIFVEDVEKDERFLKPNDNLRYTSSSFITMPLRVRDKVLGVLNVNSPDDGKKFEEKDMLLLSVLADQSALLFENIDLYDNIQNFYLEIIQALARTIDAKDSYTHEHADRARKYARLICKKLNLPEPLIRHIEYAALVHDIGKIGIKEEILNKAGKLEPEEEEALRKHPVIGNRIIEPVAFLSPVAPMVHHHHEWYNGEGYPDGLAGEEIPLGSRIVSVIDAYDAMTTDRPYHKAYPKEDAIKELINNRGKQFDPKVVDAFLQALNEEKK
ncbi:MAG: HD domain-containing protein [Elusimicrobia bacterium]|nr:HD domain-containing protein [Elusimicrobiota bacterium]